MIGAAPKLADIRDHHSPIGGWAFADGDRLAADAGDHGDCFIAFGKFGSHCVKPI